MYGLLLIVKFLSGGLIVLLFHRYFSCITYMQLTHYYLEYRCTRIALLIEKTGYHGNNYHIKYTYNY